MVGAPPVVAQPPQAGGHAGRDARGSGRVQRYAGSDGVGDLQDCVGRRCGTLCVLEQTHVGGLDDALDMVRREGCELALRLAPSVLRAAYCEGWLGIAVNCSGLELSRRTMPAISSGYWSV